jgi:hypothetical protein
MHRKVRSLLNRIGCGLFVVLILFAFCSVAYELVKPEAPAQNYTDAVRATMSFCFETEGDNNHPIWSSCVMSKRSPGKNGPYNLPDGKHRWRPNGPSGSQTCIIAHYLEDGLIREKQYEPESFTVLDHLVMDTIPHGACRWRCDPEEDPEQCLPL